MEQEVVFEDLEDEESAEIVDDSAVDDKGDQKVDDDPSGDKPDDVKDDKDEKKVDKKDDISEQIKEIKTELEKKSSHIKDLNKAIHSLRQENKELKKGKPDDEEIELTDAQLLDIMREHKDDEAVLLQVIKTMQKQSGKSIEERAKKAGEITSKKNEISRYIKALQPDFDDEGSEVYTAVGNAVEYLHLDDHPFGRQLAYASLRLTQLPKLLEQAKEEGKKEALKQNVDASRKQAIKDKAPVPSGEKKGDSAPSQNLEEAAARLGFKPGSKPYKEYMKIMSKAKK